VLHSLSLLTNSDCIDIADGLTTLFIYFVGNEGDFTREHETVFRLYLVSHSSAVNKMSNLEVGTHALQAVRVWLKSVAKEWHFTREHETVFLLDLASHSSGVTETSYLELPTLTLQPAKVCSKSVSNQRHYTR
jgi:hypothetical protein